MNDHIKSEIAMYLAGQLTESRNRQIESHAASCDKCRSALSKAKAKQARVKREALKKASPEKVPNLFLARQEKAIFGPTTSLGKARILVALLLLVGGGYWAYQRWVPKSGAMSPAEPATPESVAEPSKPSAPTPVATPTPAQTPKPPVVSTTPVIPANITEAPKVPLTLAVIQAWSGEDCAIRQGRLVVVRRAESWQNLWTEMQMTTPLPEVNFDDHIVLAVFAGEQPAGTSVTMGKIVERGDEMLAPYFIKAPIVQVSTPMAPVAPALSHPYYFAVVPRIDRKIKLARSYSSL